MTWDQSKADEALRFGKKLKIFSDEDSSLTVADILHRLNMRADQVTGPGEDAEFLALDPEDRRTEWGIFAYAMAMLVTVVRVACQDASEEPSP